MPVRPTLLLLQVVAYFALLLAGALVALNIVHSSRRAIHGEGPRPIPVLVTVLGVLALRGISLVQHRPALFGVWPVVTVVIIDLGSWLLPPLVCRWLGLTAETEDQR
jgi:hypothetical protein